MKLLKELFYSDEFEDQNDYSSDDEDEFDFDFDPQAEQELNFDDENISDHFGDEYSEEEDYGAEEDYPESMIDMPHDEYEDDEEGGLIDPEAEIDSIKDEIEGLYARLGKLAAAGDLNLMDEPPEDGFDFGEEEPEFSSFRDMDLGLDDDYDDDYGDEFSEFEDEEDESEFEDEFGSMRDTPEFR
jgi:hypothetical protein